MTNPARTARRQLLVDRIAEHLDGWGSPHAVERATRLLTVVDELGFRLPPEIEDPPPLRSCPGDSPGRRRFAEARAVLALPHAEDCTPALRSEGQHAAGCERCERAAALA